MYREHLFQKIIDECEANAKSLDSGAEFPLLLRSEKENSYDLQLKIEKFINTKIDIRIQMGINARENVIKKFDEKIIIDKYLKLII